MSKYFDALCEREWIMHEVVPSYNAQQNGIAERKNITIMGMVRGMLKYKHLPNELWGEVLSTATYILNKFPTKKLEGIKPEECWFGVKKLSLSHLKVFGSIAHRHVSDQLRRKSDDKSSHMILIGYHLTGGYKLFDPLNKQVVINRDMIID